MTVSRIHKNAEIALKSAIYNLVQERKKTGSPVVVWQGGKVVRLNPRNIRLSRISR